MGDGHEQRPGGIEKAGTVSEGRGQMSKGLGHQVTGSLALSWGRWSALKLKRGQRCLSGPGPLRTQMSLSEVLFTKGWMGFWKTNRDGACLGQGSDT